MKKAFLILCVICLLIPFAACGDEERDRLFDEALAALQTPAEEALSTGVLNLRCGESLVAPWLRGEVVPYDELEETPIPKLQGTLTSSDADVVSVDASGVLTALACGEAELTYATPEGEKHLTVLVTEDGIPFGVQNYIYVLRREFYTVKRAKLPKYNKYAKWYYGKRKEVGWCSVFTIYCANASGNNPIKLKEAEADPNPLIRFFREGQVGHQFDGFDDMGRFVGVPKPGYLVIYAELKNGYRTTHIGSVTDVEYLGEGRYAVETVEGNMSNSVKGYRYVYDSTCDNHTVGSEKGRKLQKNMSKLPKEEQTNPLLQYELHTDHWAVFGFCATYE